MEKRNIQKLEPCLLNIFGLGKWNFSASIASLIAAAIFYLFTFITAFQFLPEIFFILILAWTVQVTKKYASAAEDDLKEIVIDEFLGMWLCLVIAESSSPFYIAALFVIFRALDLLKPPPFNYLDKKLKGKFAYLIDDLAIGFAAGLVYRVFF